MKNYLIVLRMQEMKDAEQRTSTAAHALQEISHHKEQPRPVFGTPQLSGWLIQTNSTPKQISDLLQGRTRHTDTSPLLNEDSFLVLETGPATIGIGVLEAATTWLSQHRLPSGRTSES